MLRRPALCLLLLFTGGLLLTAACGPAESTTGGSAGASGGAGSGGAGGGPPTLTVVYGAPGPLAKSPDAQEYDLDGYASAVGSSGALVAIGTTTGVYQATPQGISKLDIVGDEPDLPLETGQVHAIAPYEQGVLVAADTAVFYTAGGVLQLSLGNSALYPLGITALTARVADDDGDGAEEAHLVAVAKDGAYEIAGEALTQWTVTGESGAPSAAFGQKGRIILAFGDRVYEIDKAKKVAYPLVFSIGKVSAIACDSLACDEGSTLYFATGAGLAERSGDGSYALYPLAEKDAAAVPAEGFAFDAGRQRLYAIAGDAVVRVRPDAVPDVAAPLPKGDFPRVMAFDKLGDLWVGDGPKARSFALGTPLSFEADVKPIMHEYCAPCHLTGKNGAPPIDFEDYDKMVEYTTKAMMRISEGSMPPLGSGYPPVPKEKIQILSDWSATKAK